jgi:N-acetyl-anhydromuramyl-L-alanine amidase AmpD
MLTIDQSRHSPNKDSRNGQVIDMVVMHATVGRIAGSLSWLSNPASRVSTHYVIDKAGHIYQLVADADEAWHAGKASWFGHTNINQRSIGIELENLEGMEMPDGSHHGPDPYPAVQIDAARWLCAGLIAKYHITPKMFVRHLDVAPGRKTDPAHFPWVAFVNSLYTSTPPPAPISNASALIAPPRATQQQCIAAILAHPNGEYTPYDVASIVRSYYAYAAGLDPALAIAQMCHETAYLASNWAARPRRNPAGLGVNGTPGAGLSFETWELAVRCHIGRLLAYALKQGTGTPGQQVLIDNALALRSLPTKYRGVAPTLVGLNGKWAPSNFYTDKIVTIANQIVRMG